MGWASGSSLLEKVARATMPHIPKERRKDVARELIAAFERADCDTICEVEQEDIRAIYDEMYPPEEPC